MTNYVRKQSAGDILRNSVTIYKNNFLALFLIYILPIFPLLVVQQYATVMGNQGLQILAVVLIVVVSLMLFPPFTVAISEICLGNKASMIHSFQRVLEKGLSGFIGTYFLLVLILAAGMLLLIIPGIVFSIWYMFTLQVSVLERVFRTKALKRSKELGKGIYWRNFGISLLLYFVVNAAALLLAGLLGVFFGIFFPEAVSSSGGRLLLGVLGATIGHLLNPLPFIGIVLLYYDMRARKEAYDTAALAEDLMR